MLVHLYDFSYLALYLDELTHVKDMGLGKTLSTLALIMSCIDASSQLSQSSSGSVGLGPTLIVTSLSRKFRRKVIQLRILLIY